MPTKCYFLEETNRIRRYLRRYVTGSKSKTQDHGYHQAWVFLDDIERTKDNEVSGDLWPHDDPKWPEKCVCGYVFKEDETWQLFINAMYKRQDTGELVALREAPPGAMWYADWMPNHKGPDGHCLVVRLPNGGDWMVDGVASNCTRPGEKHQCWVRSGIPPNVTAGKQGGNTCSAGAGSIGLTSNGVNYHGFLRDGILT